MNEFIIGSLGLIVLAAVVVGIGMYGSWLSESTEQQSSHH